VDPVWQAIVDECKKREIGYADLGRMCGVTRSTAYAWINGGSEPTLGTVRRLAGLLGFKLLLARRDGTVVQATKAKITQPEHRAA
jgi:transcriptional regulator with XRE-family HTH domain